MDMDHAVYHIILGLLSGREKLAQAILEAESDTAMPPLTGEALGSDYPGRRTGAAIRVHLKDKGAEVDEATALSWGLSVELYEAFALVRLPGPLLRAVTSCLRNRYGTTPLACGDYEALYQRLQDSKDREAYLELLSNEGGALLGTRIGKEVFFEALDFLRDGL